jgi:outer membrane protein TolC
LPDDDMRLIRRAAAAVIACTTFGGRALAAQSAADSPLTLARALAIARGYAPRLKARASDVDAAESGVTLSRQLLLPTVDVGGQALRATDNNITGALFPQSVILAVSGPVRPTTSTAATYASAYGASFAWAPTTFGRVSAQRTQARATLAEARANATGALFDEQVQVSATFLELLAAQELVRVQAQALARAEAVARVVRTLAANGLRPGADSLLASADVSRARIELLTARRNQAATSARFGELLGMIGRVPPLETHPWLDTIPERTGPAPALDASRHPRVEPFAAQIAVSDAREAVAARSALPRVSLVAGLSVRGSGIGPDGVVDPRLGAGLSAARANTAIGFMVTLPVSDALFTWARAGIDQAHAEADRQELVAQEDRVKAQAAAADTSLALALAAAREVPTQLAAASAAYGQMSARYSSGLATVADLAQAQYVLTRAEADAAVARVGAWHAWLDQCAARGDLAPFLARVK